MAAPKKLIIYNALDHIGEIASLEKVENSFNFVQMHYRSLKAEPKLSIIVDKSKNLSDGQLTDYLNVLK